MPGMTPNFGIRYPCAGEPINPTVFQNFADDVEAALTTVNVNATAALERPRGAVRTPTTGTSTAVNVLTAMAYTITDFSSGVTVIANGFTTLTGGCFMVTGEFSGLTTVTTVTSFAGEIQNAGVTAYRHKLGFSTIPTEAFQLNVSGIVYCPAAANITGHWQWTGTGGPMFVYSRMTIARICEL